MPKTSYEQMQYIKDYNREHIYYRKLSFNVSNEDDMRMMKWLDERPQSTSSYLKQLIREDMNKNL